MVPIAIIIFVRPIALYALSVIRPYVLVGKRIKQKIESKRKSQIFVCDGLR